jgi:uncharacterized membrane protein
MVLRFLHVVAGTGMIAGIVGRAIVLGQAGRSAEIGVVQSLVEAAGRFEGLLVRPGSIVLLGLGILLAWIEGWPLFGFIQGGKSNWLLVSLLLYLTSFPLIVFVFVPRGKVFEKILEGASAQGRVTPELTAAFSDEAVRNAHYAEALVIAVILFLMVAKPI